MKIIFVCTGNTCRSPMAKFLLESLLTENQKKQVEVLSAGACVYMSEPISRHAKTLLMGRNIDPSAHLSRLFTPDMADSDTIILTMGKSHKNALLAQYPFLINHTYTLSEYVGEDYDISDPFGGSLETYRICMSEIEKLVNKLYFKL